MDITEYDEFYKWYKANERRFHFSQMTEVQIAYSAYLHGIEMKRNFIGIDNSEKYNEIAKARIKECGGSFFNFSNEND